ncbi:putative fused transcriptional regulator/phosphomethylpyrimidine kinase/putative transcriptional regulator [Halarchaeum solikamskense]|uniref:thiamine-phosphate synthase family protein n=1 Tax=Halarchaeum nitratireducens TaxID=489913 RepID=UPI001B3A7DA1|nr:thiamine-phosphate synthase family protein [Halarchaeum solikamskense]MBP2251597.1 putative fused transcriptional regulator/phosphomethylpyrimidine kinase/putative transcriptional regulator [Halarchaeum solikamskense]
MRFLEEVVVDEFLPTYRSLLAAALRDRGLTQQAVADLLGVSQSAVSKYAKGEVGTRAEIETDERVTDHVAEVADGLADGTLSRVGALAEAEALVRDLEAPGDVLADIHAEQMPELAGAGVDFRGTGEGALREREHVLADLRRGVKFLERASGFATLIPAVGSNLVECLPDAETPEDVAGVPGRIFDVMGRTTVPSDPEFGVSAHVATVLLAARDAGSDARAAINVAYSPDLIDSLAEAGYAPVEFPAESESDDTRSAVRDAVADAPDTRALYQTGGYGVEPIVYVLGDDAPSVAAAVRSFC